MAKRTNYNKISTETAVEEKMETVATPEEPVIEEAPAVKIVKGIVSGCLKLNVRKEAKKDAGVLAVIDVKTKVEVEPDNSTDKWYKVITKDGVEGYCMKEFITLKK